MPEVEIPEIGTVSFPEEMSEQDIGAAAHQLYTTRKGMKDEMADAARTSGRMDTAAKMLDWAGLVVKPFASTSDNPFGAIGTAAKAAGGVINAVGDEAVRMYEGVMGSYGLPTGEIDRAVVKTIPTVAASMGGAGALARTGLMGTEAAAATAFGGVPFAQTLAATDDTFAAVKSGMVGAAIPGLAGATREAAAKVMGDAVRRGVMSGDAVLPQKLVEALSAQGSIQVFMEGMNLPEYMQMEPEERKRALLHNLAVNSVFLAMDVPGLMSKTPSATQHGVGGRGLANAKVGEVMERIVNDPQAVEALRVAADDAARTALDPNAAHAMPKSADTLVARPAELQELPPELVPFRGREVPVDDLPPVSAKPADTALPSAEQPAQEAPTAESPVSITVPQSRIDDGLWTGDKPGDIWRALEGGLPDGGKVKAFTVGDKLMTAIGAEHRGGVSVLNGYELLPAEGYQGKESEPYSHEGAKVTHRGVSYRLGPKTALVGEIDGPMWRERLKAMYKNGGYFTSDKTYHETLNDMLEGAGPIKREAIEQELGTPDWTKHKPAPSMKAKPADLPSMGAKSQELKAALRAAGFIRGDDGVSGKGIALVKKLAKEQGLRDWPDTRTVADYDALINAVKKAVPAESRATPVETPAAATAKVQEHVAETAQTKGPRPAKEIKSELIERLEKALAKAPEEGKRGQAKITIQIPGDGEFTLVNTKENLADVLKHARRLETRSGWSGRINVGESLNAAQRGRKVRKDAIEIYGERTAVAKLREQAENKDLEMDERQRAELRDAADDIEAQLPEVKARAAIEKLTSTVTDTRELLEMAEARLVTEQEAAKAAKANLETRARTGKSVFAASRKSMAAQQRAEETKRDIAGYRKTLAEAEARLAKAQEQASQVTPASSGNGAQASPMAAVPGGELGAGAEPPPPPADNPQFSAFDALPVEMPEAVRFARDLMDGRYPKIVEKIGALSGRAAGVFKHSDGPQGRGNIDLRADLVRRHFQLPPELREKFNSDSMDYAHRVAGAGDDVGEIAEARYRHLYNEWLEARKRENPLWAMKVLWHEIGHLVDWLPDKTLNRGNILGHIAALKTHLTSVLPIDPSRPAGEKPTEADRAKLRAEAEKQLRAEMGPIQEIVETVMVEEPILRMVGITADDVKNLFGINARETMPELYRWFAEQPAATKKDIVKKAMRGVLDERLAALGKAEQVGTKRTEKTIRKKVGREPTPEEIRERFQKLFREELERRNLAHLGVIKGELEPMIAWWRGTKQMENYFKTGIEMYAEAFSIFLNNPAAVAQRAPNYYRLMHHHMSARPAVAELYGKIQDQIRTGTVMRERVASLREMWSRDDARSLENFGERLRTSARDFLDNVRYHVDRRFGPIYERAKGYAHEGRVRDAVGNFLYRGAEHELFLNRVNRDVSRPLVGANLDWNDLGEYMFHQRIVNDRYALFNPQGWTSKNSLERLAEMREQLGEQRFAALEAAQRQFRKVYEEEVIPLLHEARMFKPATQELIDTAVWYSTFAAVKGEPMPGIDRLLQNTYGNIGPQIYRQIGNLGEIKQPATATSLKALSLISAAHRNIAKREVAQMLLQQTPNDIMEADTRWTGKQNEIVMRDTPDVGTVVFMDNGRARGFYVRKVVADALNFGSPVENRLLGGIASANGWLKGLFTQLNYAFWPVNFVRDTGSFMLNMPGANTPGGWAKALPRAIAASRASVKGREANPHADAALKRRMLISRADPRGVWDSVDNEFDLKVASFGMDPAQWDKQAGKVTSLVKLWNRYREVGQTFERVNKIAGMIYLDEKFPHMPEWKKREIVRERAGSPDFLQRGASNHLVDLAMMFYNPWKEGVRSVIKAAKENPFSFGAKFASAVILPSLTQAAATNGLLGEDMRKKYRSIPDYDLTNYYCIPLGWSDESQGKVAYLRLPLPEPMRIGHGLLFKATTGRGQGYGAFLGGQVPGANPMFGALAAWAEWGLFGHNPYDSFRGQPVLDETTFQAGGKAAAGEMAKWTWNELGGSLVHRFQNTQLESPPQEQVEKFLRLPVVNNALGRWVKVSNRGIDDADRELTQPIQQHRAELRLGVREVMRKLLEGGALTDSEKVLMREPYAIEYLMRTMPEVAADRELPLLRRLNRAQSQEEKAAILGADH